jgi:hypothetical protein
MDGSIPRIQGARPTQPIRPVHRRRPEDGDGQSFEEKLEDSEPDGESRDENGDEHADESKEEREDLDVGVPEDDEAGGSLDLTA